MLYMVKMTGFDNNGNIQTLVKVGRTQDLAHRVLAYKVHNPLAYWVGYKAGYVKGEQKAHERMVRLGCTYYCDDMADDESTYTEWMNLPNNMTAEELAEKMHFTR